MSVCTVVRRLKSANHKQAYTLWKNPHIPSNKFSSITFHFNLRVFRAEVMFITGKSTTISPEVDAPVDQGVISNRKWQQSRKDIHSRQPPCTHSRLQTIITYSHSHTHTHTYIQVLKLQHTDVCTALIWNMYLTYRCLLKGSFGVGASSSVVDGRNLLVEQGTLVLVGLGGRDVVHPRHDMGLGWEGDQRHPRVLRRNGEVRQHLAYEPQLAQEIAGSHAGGLVHQED